MNLLGLSLLCCYLAIIAIVCTYGLHRYWIVTMYLRYGGATRNVKPARRFERLPRVTVQLPMYNESKVAERIIAAACALEYPRDRLQVQVLDDSTDESAAITARICARLCSDGHDVEYRHRNDRTGFKAGALDAGMATATGEYIAVFDADFVPASDTLRRAIDHFTGDSVGMVQLRWDHLNRDDSLLTKIQALYLDGHFVVEQAARAGSGRWFNFNGTAGIWRKTTIEDAGGWQHDTLTEDTDLSYRAQLAGWRFVYLSDVSCPAEVPPTVPAFLGQQHRWNKGLIQTAIKLMPRILRSDAPWPLKIEAWFHLTSPVMHLVILLLALLVTPALFVAVPGFEAMPIVGVVTGALFMLLGATAASTFYIVSQWRRERSALGALAQMPALMAIGVGISVVNSRAVIEALLGIKSPFVRTPKFNGAAQSDADPIVRRGRHWPTGAIETTLGLLMLGCFTLTFLRPAVIVGAPFLLLFGVGFLCVGLPQYRDWRKRVAVPVAAS